MPDTSSKTTATITTLMESVEDRHALLQAGMEKGAGESYDRLAERLQTMA